MGTPNWATYFDGIEPDYPGRPREDKHYGYCPQQTQDTRKRKQGMVFPEDTFKLQDLENIQTATGRISTSGSWRSTSGSRPPCSHPTSPSYTSSSIVSDVQYVPPVSANQGRALPPIPVEADGCVHSGSVRSCSDRSQPKSPLHLKLSPNYSNRELPLIPVEHRKNIHNESKSKRKRQHGEKSTRRSRKKPGDHDPETAVVLTVSIRNGKHTKNVHHSKMLNNNIDDGFTSTFHVKKPLESTLSRERAAKEADKITVPLRSSVRMSRKRCLVPMVIITILILAGLLSAVAFILLRPLQEESSSEEKDGLVMILAITHMRILNKKFVSEMSNSSSPKFLQFSSAFEDDINDVFLRSNISRYFYGTSLNALRNGSIYTYSDLSFQDVEHLRDPSIIQNVLRDTSAPFTYRNMKAIRIGDNIVDYDSIHVDLSFVNVDKFPDKPKLKELRRFIEEVRETKNSEEAIQKTTERPKKIQHLIPEFSKKKPLIPIKVSMESTSVVENEEPEVIKSVPETTTFSNDVSNRLEEVTTAMPLNKGTTTFVSKSTTDGAKSSTEISGFTTSSSETTSKITTTTTTLASTTISTTRTNDPRNEIDQSSNKENESLTTPSTTKTPISTPYVKVTTETEAVGTTGDHNATVTCNFGNLEDWKFLIIRNMPYKGKPYLVMNLTSDEMITIPPEIKDRLYLNLDVNSVSGTIRISFLLQCGDLGRYECKVHKGDYSFIGGGELKLLPTKPKVTLPVEIIEGKALQEPLLCTINVGFPAVKSEFEWLFKAQGMDSFQRIGNTDNSPKRSGVCGQIKTIRLELKEPPMVNDVQVKCVVKRANAGLSSLALEDVATIEIVPSSLCNGVSDNTLIKHPYTCDKYVQCTNTDMQVKQCPDNLCFDPTSQRCGQTGLEMTSADAYLNEGVTLLSCRLLHVGAWTSISIYKHASNGNKSRILIAYNDSTNPEVEKEVSHRFRATIDKPSKYEVNITLWVYSLECKDEGQFSCTADVPFAVPEAFGRLNIKAKPDVPSITIPTEIIDSREPREWFKCEGNVGYPKGKMYWEIRLRGNAEFTNQIPFQTKRDHENTTNCKSYVTNEFRFTPNKKHDGMEVRCVVENQDTMPSGRRLYTTKKIHVIPANFCAGISRDKRAHPNNCYQYIQCHDGYTYVQRCSIGLCFNPETQECDIRQEKEVDVIDPEFPCKPNRNGVYFPHDSICNKYIWCVQGQEVIQHCPLGTQYFKDGQCTFEEDKFHCSRNSTSA
ncbi:uncharacterized protein LOC133176554 [Saccostrea echinata]|uniref:uncharacterized protein LOC133176554 n=1 Tax=Saccostrea echinata TaxID=191078 RepID=UPI002A7F59F9|nr:uncharacterized protein LOC133176554 [Saccostrea echinata]